MHLFLEHSTLTKRKKELNRSIKSDYMVFRWARLNALFLSISGKSLVFMIKNAKMCHFLYII